MSENVFFLVFTKFYIICLNLLLLKAYDPLLIIQFFEPLSNEAIDLESLILQKKKNILDYLQ